MGEADFLTSIEELILSYNPNADFALLEKAHEFAMGQHKGQKRKSGEPFVIHPEAVAYMLAEMEMDMPSIIAGLLHDVIEDTSVSFEEVEKMFGKEIAYLVDGVTKLKRIPMTSKEEQQAENLRRMFLKMADDIRVILIKLVDRLHNMRTLQYIDTDTQISKARETLEIYTPIAHRLGMTKIKWELEDLCLKYLDPERYEDLNQQIKQRREEQEEYIKIILDKIKEKTNEMNINAFLDGRPKHLYSLHKKMIRQNKSIDQIYDLIAVRIIVDTVKECYMVLGIIHELFKPMPGRFKDYIAMPKPNMYQSLHTTLIGPDGQPFESQIRTWEMHKISEIGIAAHWKYKEGGKSAEELEGKIEWIRNLLNLDSETRDSSDFVETFKMDLFTDEVYVFTPKGDVINLPAGSTPIDFAYNIHSAVGHRMIGAKVNSEIKPLTYKLKTGEIVEIITTQNPNHAPSRDWLNIVKSSEAKSKIRQWFKKERKEENIERGKDMVEKELRRQSYTQSQLFKPEWTESLLKRYNLHSLDDLYNVIGFGEMSAQKVVQRLRDNYLKATEGKTKIEEAKEPSKVKERPSENGIIVKGIDNCLVRLAGCCNPVPGDSIVGYITRGRGVSVHRTDCPNINSLSEEGDNRMIDVRWSDQGKSTYMADIEITAVDRSSLLLEIANIIANEKLNMKAINARATKDNYDIIHITIEISSRPQLDQLIKKLKGVENVLSVTRTVK